MIFERKIREKKEREAEMERQIQRKFDDSLRSVIEKDTLENHDFQDLIEGAACPNTRVDDEDFVTLQFAAHKQNELVEYLLRAGADPNIKDIEQRFR
ncbi:hypothetical protein BC827DRAFT_264609 [Russula dissimulans]|nr:hypothetical protein BC827DRAFT_264609 [Russula dissimulans]